MQFFKICGTIKIILNEIYRKNDRVSYRGVNIKRERNRNMETAAMLDELQRKANQDSDIKKALLETRKQKNPVAAFCRKCQELGYPIYEMDLISAGEDFYASMRRSTNGGGENSPMLEGEDDFYELFFASLETVTQ